MLTNGSALMQTWADNDVIRIVFVSSTGRFLDIVEGKHSAGASVFQPVTFTVPVSCLPEVGVLLSTDRDKNTRETLYYLNSKNPGEAIQLRCVTSPATQDTIQTSDCRHTWFSNRRCSTARDIRSEEAATDLVHSATQLPRQ